MDKDNISAATIKKISVYTSKAEFVPSNVAKVSKAAASLCGWVRGIDEYSKVMQTFVPKREKLAQAKKDLEDKKARLQKSEEDYAILVNELG